MTRQIYQGKITLRDLGEADDILFVETLPSPDFGDDPFVEIFQDDLKKYGSTVSVQYYISGEPRTIKELTENAVSILAGAADARYEDHWSDLTGYLWTDQDLSVGGHDLWKELASYKGRYLYMIVDFA